jgi:SAM-dependent methyltransferase
MVISTQRIFQHPALPDHEPVKDRHVECDCKSVVLQPVQLRELVAGPVDVTYYLETGHAGAQVILDLCRSNAIDVTTFRAILDFGCGCGRVLLHLSEMLDKRIFGTDYNQKLIAWLSNHLANGTVFLNDLSPPTQHATAQFDLVYALSVFTHLTEEMQIEWMSEFSRIIRTGGHLILTTHGNHGEWQDRLTKEEKSRFSSGQIVVRDEDLQGSNDCFTVQSEQHVRNVLCDDFDIVEFRECGALGNPPQDIYLLRRRVH